MQKSIKRTISILLSILMVVSLFVAVPITASAATQDDIFELVQNMHMLVEDRVRQDDFEAVDALHFFSQALQEEFNSSGLNANAPNVERAYNIALAVYKHFNGTGSVGVTSVSIIEVDALRQALDVLIQGYQMSGDWSNTRVLQFASDMLFRAAMAASGNSEDPNLLSAYSLASTVLAQYTGTTSSYTVTWKDWNGSVLETDENVAEGTTPTYDGAIPTKDGCTFTGWTDGDNTYGLNDALPGVTVDVTYIAVFTYSDGIGASLAGHSISLEGDIAVNFYMEIAPEVVSHEGAYMQFTVPDTSKEYQDQKIYIRDLEPVIIGDKTYYVFKCKVAAKDMASEITSQLIDGDKASTVYTYSVKGYADYLILHQDDSQTFKDAVPLVEAMLQYGTYATNCFSDANALEALDGDIPAKEAAVNNLPEGVTFEGATLSLKSQTTLSLYFISEQELTLSMDGKTEGVDYELAHNGSEYVIRIRNISSAELNDDFTITYTSNGQSGTVTYSPMTYCYKAANSQAADVKLKNVVKALYRYWLAAAQYFNKNQGGN